MAAIYFHKKLNGWHVDYGGPARESERVRARSTGVFNLINQRVVRWKNLEQPQAASVFLK